MTPSGDFDKQIAAMKGRLSELQAKATEKRHSVDGDLSTALDEIDTALEELRVTEEELCEQNEALAAAQQAFEDEQRRFRDLFAFAPDGFLTTDRDGIIREANLAASRLLNVSPRALAGKPLSNYVPVESRKEFRSRLASLVRVDRVDDWVLDLQPRGRSAFPASITVAVMRDREGQAAGLYWQFRDISRRIALEHELRQLLKEAEASEEQIRRLNAELERRVKERTAELRRATETLQAEVEERARLHEKEQKAHAEAESAARRLEYLQAVTDAVLAHLDLDSLLRELLDRLKAILDADNAAVLLLDPGGRFLTVRAARGPQEAFVKNIQIPFGRGIVGRVATLGEPIVVQDLAAAEVYGPFLKSGILSSLVAVPLRVQERVIGALHVGTIEPRQFADQDVSLLQLVADRMALAIERTRLYESEQLARKAAETAKERLSFLAEASAILATSLDYETTLRRLARLCVPTLADYCLIDVVGKDRHPRRIASAHAEPSKLPLLRTIESFVDEEGPPAGVREALQSGRPTLIPEVTDEILESITHIDERKRALRALGPHSVMIVPILLRGEVLGAMTLVSSDSGRRFTEDDLTLAQDLAHRAALAVESARLYHEARDISRRLEDSLALLETVFAGAPVGLAFLDRDLRYIHINEALARRHGVSIADHIGRTLGEVIPDLAPRLEPLYRKVLRTGLPVHDEPITAVRPGSSEPGHFLASYYPVQNSLGETLGVGAVVVDVTERTRAEEALRESEERYRTIVQTANEGIWLVDPEGRTLYLNHHMAEMLGVEPADVIGRPVPDFCFPEDVAAARERIASNLAGRFEQFDFRFRHQDGRAVYVLACTSPVRDAHGTVTGALGMFTDTTERRRTEEAQRFLAEAGAILTSSLDDEAMLRSLAELAVTHIADYANVDLVVDAGRIERLHVACADPRNADFARRLKADPPRNDPNRRTAMVLRTGEPILASNVDAEWIAKTGNPERIRLLHEMGLRSIIMAPLLARGHAIGVITLVSTTPARQYGPADLALAQELGRRAALAVENTRLRHQAQEALRTRDQFLAVVSHDLKNPIASIQLYTQMIRRAANRNRLDIETVLEDLGPIEVATRRMIALIDELMDVARLEMARPLPLHPRPVDVIALARQLIEEYQRGADDCRVTLETSLTELVGYWDAPRIERVLGNLLSNAIKYSPDGGDVTVTITEESGQWAVISVRDHGVGIEPEDVPRIFEPFQRGEKSRPDVPGIGIGLTSARQIAEQHGGSITVESAPGEGSTFTIRLPTAQEKHDAAD